MRAGASPAAGYVLAVLLGGAAGAAGVAGLLGWPWTLSVPALVPLGGLELTLDPLAGFFLILVGGTAIPAAIYAMGDEPSPRTQALAFNAFVVSMALVPLAANAVTFLLAWELTALSAYFLVVERALPRHADEVAGFGARDAIHAGWMYAVVSHAGLACLLAGMLLMGAATGSLHFADWRAAAGTLAPGVRLAAFAFLAVAFAGGAAVMPLHRWLPLVQPAAPVPVAALMSGTTVTLGLYGLIRAAFEWLTPGPASWGAVLLLAGAMSALAGILRALTERDVQRVLAFSTLHGVGVVLVAIGGALAFRAADHPVLAVLSLAAGLYHALNHAAFKALLVLGAGALARGAGSRDLDAMGGLLTRMPWTAACFLVGSLASAAVPPLNGFASEWLIFHAFLPVATFPATPMKLVFIAGLASLALTAGLAVACFVRASGAALLDRPRGVGAAVAREVNGAARAPMLALGAACLALGVTPMVVLPALTRVAAGVVGGWPPGSGSGLTATMPDDARLLPLAAALALALGIALATVLRDQLGRGRRIGDGGTRLEVGASARASHHRPATPSPAPERLAPRLARIGRALTAWMRLGQSPRIAVDLSYIVLALLVLLILA